MRIVLVTGRGYASIVESVAEELRREGFDVVVEVGDAEVASLVSPGFVERVARSHRGALVILPPGLRVDAERLSRETGAVVVWGPSDPRLLPLILRERREGFKPGERLEQGTLPGIEPVSKPLLAEPCGLPLYPSPPPVTILYEVMHDKLGSLAEPSIPAHGVIVGFPRGVSRSEARSVLEEASSRLTCWGVDSDNDDVLLEAVDAGASLLLSIHPGREGLLHSLPKGRAVVLIPSGLGEAPPRARERVERLGRLAEAAREAGLVPLLDPLLAPPCLGLLDSLAAYREASGLGYPLLAGLGNVYELIDADATGVIALLSALLVEAGVSVFLITSESWKARRAHVYAPIAAAMASTSCPRRRPPKDLGLDLLVSSEKRPVGIHGWEAKEVLNADDARVVEFERDPAGDNIVAVGGDGVLTVIHRWPDGRVEALRSQNPYRLYRAALARGYATRLDHAAWLGFEIGVAYTLARMGRTYASTARVRISVGIEEAMKALKVLSVNPATRQRGREPPQTP